MLTPSVPSAYKGTPAVVGIVIQNAMACRVYRGLKLGILADPSAPPSAPKVLVHIQRSTIASNDIESTLPRMSDDCATSPMRILKNQRIGLDRTYNVDVEMSQLKVRGECSE